MQLDLLQSRSQFQRRHCSESSAESSVEMCKNEFPKDLSELVSQDIIVFSWPENHGYHQYHSVTHHVVPKIEGIGYTAAIVP